MSEKIYALLLRLFPAAFRKMYGDEALQLFRDRFRDERGALRRLRLWSDLLFDLAISVPRTHELAQPSLITERPLALSDGPLLFRSLESAHLPPMSILLAVLLSVPAFVLISVPFTHIENPKPFSRRALPPTDDDSSTARVEKPSQPTRGEASQQPVSQERTSQQLAMQQPVRQQAVERYRLPQKPSTSVAESSIKNGPRNQAPKQISRPSNSDSRQTPKSAQDPRANLQPTSAMVATAGAETKLDATAKRRVIDGAIVELKEHYIFPEQAQKMADALLAHEKNGDDAAVTDGESFGNLLAAQMIEVSHDRHIRVFYSSQALPPGLPGPTPEERSRNEKELREQNCTFEKVEILAHNIGYVKFHQFPSPDICGQTVASVMQRLNDSSAIIFDLRENGGGDPQMVALIAGYLFDRPTHLNDMLIRGQKEMDQSWTAGSIPGNKLPDKPAYVLTSKATFSGAEEFTYDLKMLKRATIVGETTGGGAHMARGFRIDDHFTIGVPFARPVNPVSKKDWEGTGVQPDVKTSATDALSSAENLAEAKLRKK